MSQLRIIAGKWRSRRIDFLSINGVRPTTDANREMLFNWLMPYLATANCLDLFAGSGALGFEALSRGANSLVMVDISPKIMAKLCSNAVVLQATNIDLICANIPKQLTKIPPQVFDIVFLDPPFHKGLLAPTIEKLIINNYVANNTLLYLEAEKDVAIAQIIPATWQILKHKKTGHVVCCLVLVQ